MRPSSKDLVGSPPLESTKAAKKEGSYVSAVVDSGKKGKKNKHAPAPVNAEDDEDAPRKLKLAKTGLRNTSASLIPRRSTFL